MTRNATPPSGDEVNAEVDFEHVAANADQELAAAMWEERVSELLGLAQLGDGEACADLRRMYGDFVANIIPIKNKRDHQAVVRKVFMLAFNQLNGQANSEDLRAHLTVVANRICNDPRPSRSGNGRKFRPNVSGNGLEPFHRVNVHLTNEALLQHLSVEKQEYARAAFDQSRAKEIAATSGESVNAVRRKGLGIVENLRQEHLDEPLNERFFFAGFRQRKR